MLSLDYSKSYIKGKEVLEKQNEVEKILEDFHKKENDENEFLGWINLPEKILNSEELVRIIDTSKKIQKSSDVLICIGIGGSYLGAEAVIKALSKTYTRQ